MVFLEKFIIAFLFIKLTFAVFYCNVLYDNIIGSFGVHVPLRTKDQQTLEFYTKMGFMEISQGSNLNPGYTYLGRVF